MTHRRADWVFAAEARSVSRARAQVAETLQDVPDEALEVVLLLTSELVTNAVRHGTGPVGVHVTWGAGGVRVSVEDQSEEWPVVREMDGDAVGGRGLVLVDGLSSAWGVLAVDAGKAVWFTLDA